MDKALETIRKAMGPGLASVAKLTVKHGVVVIEVPNQFTKTLIEDKFGKFDGELPSYQVVVSQDSGEHTRFDDQERIIVSGRLFGNELNPQFSAVQFIVAANNEAAIKLISTALEHSGRNAASVTIYGKPGVGKTHLLQATAWVLLSRGIDVVHFVCGDLFQLILDSFKKKNTASLIELCTAGKVLLLDDFQVFAKKRLPGGVGDVLFSILDAYVRCGNKIIATSDIPPIAWNLPERIVHRLILTGMTEIKPPTEDFVRKYLTARLSEKGIDITEEALEVAVRAGLYSVRDLQRIVFYFFASEIQLADAEKMVEAISTLFPDGRVATRAVSSTEEGIIQYCWNAVVDALFDKDEAALIKTRGAKLRGKLKTKHNEVRAAFCAVMRESGISLSALADTFGVSSPAVVYWIKRAQPEVMDRVKEIVCLARAERENRGGP